MPSKVELTGGAFQDSEGNVLANGYLIFRLSIDGSVSGVGNICSGITIKITLDANGNAVAGQYIWGNDNINPMPNFYTVEGYASNGQPAWGPNNQQVTGSGTFDLGTWVPNTVISWTPTVSQPVLFETNGTPNSSQTTLNLTAGSGVTLTDEGSGEIEISAGGASFSGDGAYFFGPGIIDPGYINTNGIASGGTFNTTSNQVKVFLFELIAEFTLSKASIVALGNQFGVHGYFGIYNFAGNLLVNAGAFVDLTAPGVQTNSFTPVTLPPGIYWHAQATDTTNTGQFPGVQVDTFSWSLLSANATRAAVAANVVSAGSLPATLGTLTPFTPTSAADDCMFCPLYE